MFKKLKPLLPIIGLMVYGFILRIWGLNQNFSFWTDENHAATFGRAILERGIPKLANGYSTGVYQVLLYYLIAGFMAIFGVNEFSARLPSVIFGVLTIPAIYLLAITLFNRKVGLISAFLVTFLQIEIVWSRQARPYQGLQLCYLLAAWFIYRFVAKIGNQRWNIFGFLVTGIVAASLHGLGALIIPAGILFMIMTGWRRHWQEIIMTGLVTILLYVFLSIDGLGLVKGIGNIDNIYYYRVFLTNNYLVLLIFALIGLIGLLLNRKTKQLFLLAVFCLPQAFMVSFILGQPFLRYFYIIFPFLYILAGYGIIFFGEILDNGKWILGRIKNGKNCLPVDKAVKLISNIPASTAKPASQGEQYLISLIAFVLLVIGLVVSDKLVFFPRPYYSLNEDMQEIPEVDWKKVYGFVGEKMTKDKEMILITNWNDQPIWYFGESFKDRFVMIRKPNKQMNNTDFYGERIVYSIQGLEEIRNTYPKGIIIADSWDNEVPEGYREYLQTNLKLIMEIDRLYPIQPRYWTVWVYQWDTTKP